ncbi:SMC-Scp complex subunit ScpB [Natronosporangium hydrolyticum]|uniref:SMC-Scp complex subunit ScpB n=1 Tax=Natronosporangium hydrolyticum TaxID=2811111 RepID=A0A895Y4G7_9ACTN|nr:SMC-Scp complex subunit ScpB [Natronosporangium hydrolyticum]QSB12594.1 SMC-Scp complex subunit ScpB [Natronosporangium hydrolyticum]
MTESSWPPPPWPPALTATPAVIAPEPEAETPAPAPAPAAVPAEPSAAPLVGSLAEPELRAALEAILLVVDEPVTEATLAQTLAEPPDRVAATLTELSAEYTAAGRGFDLRRAAGGWRLYTRASQAAYVERFVLDGQQAKLSQAALETLAVVAYKQPVTRSRVAAIRGVNCDGVIRTLLTRGLLQEAGAEPESGAYLYQTTSVFLEKLGLDSVAELPSLAPFLPDDVSPLDPDAKQPEEVARGIAA